MTNLSSTASNISAFLLAIAGGAIVGLAFVCLAVHIRWDDQSFYIYAAPHLLDGYHLYSPDITDTNPPLISWMTMIAAEAARAFDLAPDISFISFVLLLACAVVFWSVRLSAEEPGFVKAAPALILGLVTVLLYVTVVLPSFTWFNALRYDFGQREHILALLILPYLFSAARRLRGHPLSNFEAILVGLTAAIGFSIKPQYLTILALVELLLVVGAQGFRSLIRPELLALAFGGLAYLAAIWIITPTYIITVVPIVASVYGGFDYVPMSEMLRHIASYVLALVALVLMRRSGFEHISTTFLVAGAGAFVAYLMQHKGWSDHVLPAQMFFMVSLGVAAIGHLLQWMTREPPIVRPILLSTSAIIGCLVAASTYYPVRESLWEQTDRAKDIIEFNRATAQFPPGTSFVLLDEGIEFQFDVASDRGFVWASRYPFIMLPDSLVRSSRAPGLAHDETASPPTGDYLMISDILGVLFGHSAHASSGDYAQNLRSNIVADFRRWRPQIVLTEHCPGISSAHCGTWKGFDVIRWLSVDPSFGSLWSEYKWVKSIDDYDLYIEAHSLSKLR